MATSKAMTVDIEITMNKEKETKGTVRYSNDSEGTPITTLYVNKSAFPDGKYPDSLTVKVSG